MSLYMGKRDIFRVALTGNLMLGEKEGSLPWPASSSCPAIGIAAWCVCLSSHNGKAVEDRPKNRRKSHSLCDTVKWNI
jgi:hypothetical protein